jgi:hypothetical protein
MSNVHGDDDLKEFIIIMHESAAAWSKLPNDEQARLMSLYGNWIANLKDSGSFVTGRPCGGQYRLLAGNGAGDVTDISIETDGLSDVVTGFFVIRATDIDSAVEIAKTCPALLHGETIVVREANHS